MSNTIVNEVGDGKPGPLNIVHMFFVLGTFMSPLFTSWAFEM